MFLVVGFDAEAPANHRGAGCKAGHRQIRVVQGEVADARRVMSVWWSCFVGLVWKEKIFSNLEIFGSVNHSGELDLKAN
jgi:hypothetical protein